MHFSEFEHRLQPLHSYTPPGYECRAWWHLGHKHALGATALEACPHQPAAALGFPPARPQKSAKICSELYFNIIPGRFAEVGLLRGNGGNTLDAADSKVLP